MASAPRIVGFAPIPPTYSRLPHDDELYVIKAFTRHASHCSTCVHPYDVHRKGGSLCSKGHERALDVAQYVFNRAGQTFSVVDLDANRRVQLEIPADCAVVRELLKAMERGLRLRRKVPANKAFPLIEQQTKTDRLAVPVPKVLKEKSDLNSSYPSKAVMPASSADGQPENYMATSVDEEEEEDTPRGLDPRFQRHEIYPKYEIEGNDDLASVQSLQSFADSGYESQTTANDDSGFQDAADELKSLLLTDPELQNLFEEAFQRSRARERFVSKFRMLLKICGTELKREAINTSHEAAAHLIQAKATYVATQIRKAYETGVSDIRDDIKSANLEALLQRRYDPSSDSDSEVELAPFSLKDLKAFITTSTAFANMRSTFRRMVHPDPLTAVSNAIFREHELTKPHSTSDSSSATFHICWDVDDYIRTELGYDSKLHERKQLLESVLVVAGSASTAYATSALDYMRWRWPKSDCEILRIVHSTLTGTSNDATDTEGGTDKPRIVATLHSKTEASFLVSGSLEQIIVVAQQLAWITASFRVPVYGQVSYSEVLISRTGDMVFDLFPTPLEEVRERVSACWLPLFANSIIARGLAVPAREGEMGIEIPFALMTALANVMYPVFHTDGIYLRGFSNLLFPAMISSDMKSVQWHLITSTRARSHLPHGTLPGTTDNTKWAKCDDFEQLASAPRTFLGCYRQVHVDLGTGNLTEGTQNITYSNTEDEKPAAGMTQKSITTGFPGMGIWSAQVNMEFVLPKGLISTIEPGWYLDMLDLAKDTPLIVYDNAKTGKCAWLVPQLSVVLHMAHVWASNKTDLLRPIPTAVPHWDSGEAALGVLKRHSKDELRDGLEGDKMYCLRDLISRLLTTLHKLAESEAQTKLEPGRTVKFGGSKLYGWEFLDVVRGKNTIFRKQVDIRQDWMILGEESVVLFCQNFGDAIKPAPNVRLCPMAHSVHRGYNQLTATIKCLQRLSEERCGSKDSACLRIANQAYWLSPGDGLFKDCTHGTENRDIKATKCEKFPQQILRGYVNPKSHATPPIEGAVTFGKRKLQRPIAASQTALHPTSQGIQHIYKTTHGAKTISSPQVDAGFANTSDNPTDDTTRDANGITNGAYDSRAMEIVHRPKSTFRSLISSPIRKMVARLEEKGEETLAPPLRNYVPCQPPAGSVADLQVEGNAYEQLHRARRVSVIHDWSHQPVTRYLALDREKRPKQSNQGTDSAKVRKTEGVSVAHEPLHLPTSHHPRLGAAHQSLHQRTLDPPMHNMKERSERDVHQTTSAESLQEIGKQMQYSLDEPSPAQNRLRRSGRRIGVVNRNSNWDHQT